MSTADKIPLIECFGPTIQGEGSLVGTRCWFVRTGACDYLCTMCDSLHAVLPQEIERRKTVMSAKQIAHHLLSRMGNCTWVVLSGGNPALWDLTDLITILHAQGKLVAIETQGSIWKDWIAACDRITVSPKGPGMLASALEVEKGLEAFIRFMGHVWEEEVDIKIPILQRRDLDFAVRVQDIFSGLPLFLSVGNHFPPHLAEGLRDQDLKLGILAWYKEVVELVLEEYPTLGGARIFSQQHVLVWGNEQGR